jgi:AcrR family transcriptional regulator
MAPEYVGAGEGARSMAMLWGLGQAPTRGPRRGLELDRVVRAAVELADAEGIDAVSMRRVAERLEVGTMSLYTYVPGKGELLDLMLDAVYADRTESPEVTQAGDWRARLEAGAHEQWAFHHAHPWTLYIATGRAVLGPNELTWYERSIAVVADIGLPAREAVAVVGALSMYVRGAARDAAEAERAAQATGRSEEDWWHEREPILTEVWTAERFPVLTRVAAEGGFDVPDDTPNYNLQFILDDFEFGLQRMLDGIAAQVERARAPRPPRRRSRGAHR